MDIKNCAVKLLYSGFGFLILFWATIGSGATIQRITNNNDDDTRIDIAKDSSGMVHLVYQRAGKIYYWSNSESSSGGKEELVASGGAPAIAIGPNRVPQIAFISVYVRHTQRINGSWQTPVQVSIINEYASNVDIAVDKNNDTCFVYRSSSDDSHQFPPDSLYWSVKKNGLFSNPFLLHSGENYVVHPYAFKEETSRPAIAVDDNGKPHIAVEFSYLKEHMSDMDDYIFENSIRYYTDDGVPRYISPAGRSTGGVLSDNPIVIDSSGNIHVAYRFSTSGEFTFVIRKMDSSFNVQTSLESPGRDPSLSYNKKDNSIGVSYRDGVTLYYRIDNGSGFSNKRYFARGYWPSIALGSIDVAYMDKVGSNLEIFWASDLGTNNVYGDEWILFTPAIIDKN